ncbi:DUF192 domain-containing protein [Alloalcanivorax gelatiniphagus]|uniref:DUF192 domain-containing protein n=1 Tax=Alloalcanivorax gelatiniphagus TaxID=1194167 RepID=A0ABY2XL89_9GAMM|nr:DUF192 domain-containing protein [Alloalcanivorax gelatiniphagus]
MLPLGKIKTGILAVFLFTPEVTPAHPLPTVFLCLGDLRAPVRAEVAATPEQRGRGLMEREQLAADAGMLFRFDPPATAEQGFYMYRTLIPLDIAFLDGDGRIVDIQTMSPCESRHAFLCPVYRPGQGYHQALEVNAGFFQRHGVRPGDLIRPARGDTCR